MTGLLFPFGDMEKAWQDCATMTAPLLATKLYIPPCPNPVPRPRLIERLDAGMDHKLTLISAPASFGKTTLPSE